MTPRGRIRFEGFELDGDQARLMVEGREVALGPEVHAALQLFAARPGQVVTRAELFTELALGTGAADEVALTEVVRKLRLALGDDPAAPTFVQEEPDGSYRFVAAVEAIPDELLSARTLLATVTWAEAAGVTAAPAGDEADGAERYQVGRELGRGATSVVHEATDRRLGRKVALKLLRADAGTQLASAGGLLAEARALARLKHPNVVAVHDVGTAGDRIFLVMELIAGRSLRRWLAETRPTWHQAARVMLAAGRGLAAAHEAGLVHRDFKPDNVLIGDDGGVRVVDFGLARSLEEAKGAALAGTAPYMAPEIIAGGVADAASDQFAFAVTAYEALFGRRPYAGDSLAALAAAARRGAPEPDAPGVPRPLVDAILRALGPASERHASLTPLLAAIAHELELLDAPAPAPAAPTPQPRRKWLLVAGVVVALALVLLALRLFRGGPGARSAGQDLRSRRLTFTVEREQEPSFAPAGDRVVYVANVVDQGQFDVFLAVIAGDNRVQLTHTREDEYYPQLSPDGTTVLFGRFRGERASELWLMSALGGEERMVASDASYGDWSPDGREVAFVRDRPDGQTAIVRRTVKAGGEHVVALLPGPVTSLAWSPDGDSLAFTDGHRLYRLHATGGAASPVGPPASYIRSVSWQPRGRRLVTDANWGGRAGVWSIAATDERARPEALAAATGGTYHPAISRTGAIVYSREERQDQLWRADVGTAPRLVPSKVTLSCFDLSPDGKQLAYADYDTGQNSDAIGVLALDTLQARTLAEGGDCPRWSPDGQRIAFLRRSERVELWLLELAGGPARRVAEVAVRGQPAWSPDGKLLALPGTLPGGQGRAAMLAIDVATGHTRAIAEGDFGAASFAPDGRTLAASGQVGAGSGLYILELAGGAHRISGLASHAAPPRWKSATSLELLITERSRPTVVTLDATSGAEVAPPHLITVGADPSFWGIFEFARLPDGGLIYSQQRYLSDLYLLEPR